MLASARAIRAVESRRWRCLPTARGALGRLGSDLATPGHQDLRRCPGAPLTGAPRPCAPLAGLLCPSGGPGHVCGVSRTLPRSPSLASARLFRARLSDGSRILVRLARARLIRPATRLRPAPRAPAKTRTTLARSGGGVCGARPSRLRAGSLTRARRAALRRSAEASGACIRQARIALRFWVGAQGPGRREKGYGYVYLFHPES